MELPHRVKNLVAGTLITVGVLTPVAMMIQAAGATPPKLSFQGVSLTPCDDGSIQAVFQVGVNNLDYFTGASFFLEYNPTYLTPTDITTNSVLPGEEGLHAEDHFFQVDADLYDGDDPFERDMLSWNLGSNEYSMLDQSDHLIAMNLTLKQLPWDATEADLELKGKVTSTVMGDNAQPRYVVHSGAEGSPQNTTVVLGYLSFQVKPEYLPLVAEKFDIITDSVSPTVGSDYLIKLRSSQYKKDEPWQINYIKTGKTPADAQNLNYSKSNPGPAGVYYTFDFPRTVIDIQATEKELAVDAYQAYTNGQLTDVAATLRKFSPMATLTYTDGSRSHQVIPWGAADTAEHQYELRVYHYDASATDHRGALVTDYDPTHGDYIVQQYCYYTLEQADGTEKEYRSAVPVTVHLTVTPIHLIDVSADELYKTYVLDETLLNNVTMVANLRLPGQARIQTDVPVDGANLMLTIPGWTSQNNLSSWPSGTDLEKLVEDTATTVDHHWPTKADSGNLDAVRGDRLGTYRFPMASAMGGAPMTFTGPYIQGIYPWLSVPADGVYPLTATRVLVDEGQATIAEDYTASYVSTTIDALDDPILTLEVRRADGNAMAMGSKFRVLLPDGGRMGIGDTYAGTSGGEWENWFGVYNSSYSTAYQTEGEANGAFRLYSAPGSLEAEDGYAARRMALRRYINLGGYFYIAVNEAPDTDRAWSDYIPVYVPPRVNEHTEDKVYNFIGDNAGLHQYPGVTGTTVTVPQGDYNLVDNSGKTIYVDNTDATKETTDRVDAAGNLNQPKTAPFGAATTYDGTTGAEPGRLYTFQVEDNSTWAPPKEEVSKKVYRYGATNFVDGMTYAAYGTVRNTAPYQATIRLPATEQPSQVEGIRLIYEGTGNVTSNPVTGNVTLATYDTQKVGYTARQDYTFIIENIGDTTIYDLGIDYWTDNADSSYDGGGGHFEILKPPASYLAPGQRTTFTLTYVYDLPSLEGADGLLSYTDTLFITSSNRHTTGEGTVAGQDYLLDFDATFLVSKEDLYRVTVLYDPANGDMGTANTILGPRIVDGDEVMNLTPGSNTYPVTQRVYVVVSPLDEYEMESITCVTSNGAGVTHYEYSGVAELPDGTRVFYFDMPEDDVTVTVVFREGVWSKLRLSNLWVYADANGTNIEKRPADSVADDQSRRSPYLQRIFQKAYTEAEELEADRIEQEGIRLKGEYLMQVGRAETEGFDPSVDQYLVVIPHDADYSQVTAQLREVLMPPDAPAGIQINVAMRLFDVDATTNTTILGPEQGETNGPTTHYSPAFLSPPKGASKYVEVALTHTPEGAASVTRRYYVEIHRETDRLEAVLNYGNSPYGMIMNAENVTDKAQAKAAFDANGYTFEGLPTADVPAAVTAGGLTNIRYHREAWVKVVGSRYEPESYTDLSDYIRSNNMDLDDHALFVYGSGATQTGGHPVAEAFTEPGITRKDGVYQIWDSSGRPVDIARVRRYVEVQVLDTAATEQTARFDLPAADVPARTVRIPLDGDAAQHEIQAGWTTIPVQERNPDGSLRFDAAGEPVYRQQMNGGSPAVDADGNPIYERETVYIRPGVYQLVYLYADFDGTLPTAPDRVERLPRRPLIVLARNGDVDADGQVTTNTTTSDELRIKDRVASPLGYEAETYLDRNVFRYRVCDVNNDRNINNIDANELRGRNPLLLFYLATNYGFADPTP